MANCAVCHAETDLYELGVPICPRCVEGYSQSGSAREALRVELATAREAYRQALQNLEHRTPGSDL